MGIALFTTRTVVLPLQALFNEGVTLVARRLGLQPHTVSPHSPMLAPVAPVESMQLPQPHHRSAGGGRPLRVVRVVESARGGRSSGRMVISGRMADVCAELDRLAACEG